MPKPTPASMACFGLFCCNMELQSVHVASIGEQALIFAGQGLSIEFQAILDGDVYQPVRGVLMKLKRRRNRGCFAGRGGYCTSHA